MNIVQIATSGVPVQPTGPWAILNIIYHLAENLSKLGYKVTVIDIDEPVKDELNRQFNIVKVWVPPLLRGRSRLALWGRILPFSLQAVLKVHYLVKNGKADLIHTHAPYPLIFTLIARKLLGWKVPIIHTLHTHDIFISGVFSKIKTSPEIWAARRADHLIGQTEYTREYLYRTLNMNPSKISVLPSGIQVEEISRLVNKKSADLGEGREKTVLCVGYICRRKNQLILCKAIPKVLEQYPRIQFMFVGAIAEKSYFRSIEEFIQQKNIGKVEVIPKLPPKG
ncbi:glycosyltransferase family 4 protein [Dehalococcoidia bacterium]|nr:glycosyltransferase family 4 protein [Dehalococcoidia bacterium]